jgi:hypothetical protein
VSRAAAVDEHAPGGPHRALVEQLVAALLESPAPLVAPRGRARRTRPRRALDLGQ